MACAVVYQSSGFQSVKHEHGQWGNAPAAEEWLKKGNTCSTPAGAVQLARGLQLREVAGHAIHMLALAAATTLMSAGCCQCGQAKAQNRGYRRWLSSSSVPLPRQAEKARGRWSSS